MTRSAGFEVESAKLIGARGLVVGRKIEDEETDFFRDFDRAEGTGEEGMAWEADWKTWKGGGFDREK